MLEMGSVMYTGFFDWWIICSLVRVQIVVCRLRDVGRFSALGLYSRIKRCFTPLGISLHCRAFASLNQ